MKRIFILATLLIATISAYAKPGTQEVESDLSFAPIKIDQVVAAGQKIVQKVKVKNNTPVDATGQLEILKMYTTSTGSVVLPKNVPADKKGLTEQPFLEGVYTDTPSFTLKPGEVKEISLHINPSKDQKGTYFFIYGVVGRPLKGDVGTGGKLKQAGVKFKMTVYAVGSITIKDTEKSKVNIVNSVLSSKTNKRINVMSQVQNKGNDYLKEVTATAVLISPSNAVVSKISLLEGSERVNITPNSTKQFKGNFEGVKTTGKHQVVITIKDKENKILETKKEDIVL